MKSQDLLSLPSSGATQSGKGFILTFRLAEQMYGLPLTAVVQIIEMVAITRLPQLPRGIQGAINVHGQIVPVLDLRMRLGLDCPPYHLHTPIILTEINKCVLACVVDVVHEVIEAPLVNTQEELFIEQHVPEKQTNFLSGIVQIEQQVIPVIDLKNILSQHETEWLKHILGEYM